jgi:hypothetical protein
LVITALFKSVQLVSERIHFDLAVDFINLVRQPQTQTMPGGGSRGGGVVGRGRGRGRVAGGRGTKAAAPGTAAGGTAARGTAAGGGRRKRKPTDGNPLDTLADIANKQSRPRRPVGGASIFQEGQPSDSQLAAQGGEWEDEDWEGEDEGEDEDEDEGEYEDEDEEGEEGERLQEELGGLENEDDDLVLGPTQQQGRNAAAGVRGVQLQPGSGSVQQASQGRVQLRPGNPLGSPLIGVATAGMASAGRAHRASPAAMGLSQTQRRLTADPGTLVAGVDVNVFRTLDPSVQQSLIAAVGS